MTTPLDVNSFEFLKIFILSIVEWQCFDYSSLQFTQCFTLKSITAIAKFQYFFYKFKWSFVYVYIGNAMHHHVSKWRLRNYDIFSINWSEVLFTLTLEMPENYFWPKAMWYTLRYKINRTDMNRVNSIRW